MPSSRRHRRDEEEEEDDDMMGEALQEQRRKKKKKKKPKLFAESGLTDQQRRELRKDQRDLAHHIVNHAAGGGKKKAAPVAAKNADDTSDDEDEDVVDLEEQDNDDAKRSDQLAFYAKARSKNNQLFENVKYTREAVLDAENMQLITSKVQQQSEQWLQAPRYDAAKLVDQLATKCTKQDSGQAVFDWLLLGQQCSICFNSVPEQVSFLAGPLEAQAGSVTKEKKVRQKRTREKRDDAEEERPEEMKQGEQDGDPDKATAFDKTLKQMDKKLKKTSTEKNKRLMEAIGEEAVAERLMKEGRPVVDGVKFLVHPKSFTQTVENFFLYSFLVKKGEAGISVRTSDDDVLHDSSGVDDDFVSALCCQPTDHNEQKPATQAVLTFTMADWRRMVEATDGEQCIMPHRAGSKYAGHRSAAASQSQE